MILTMIKNQFINLEVTEKYNTVMHYKQITTTKVAQCMIEIKKGYFVQILQQM